MDIDFRDFEAVHINHLWGKYQAAREKALVMGLEFTAIVAVLDSLWVNVPGLKLATV